MNTTGSTGTGPTPPTVIVMAGAAIAITVIASLTFLVANGKDTADIFRMVNFFVTSAGTLISAVSAVYAGRAAKSVNGELESKITRAMRKVNTDG